MVKNIIQQNECVLQLSLKNSKMSYLIKKVIRHIMKRIQSKKHKLAPYKINKLSLSCFDNKSFVLDDGIYTLSYFCKNSVTCYNN